MPQLNAFHGIGRLGRNPEMEYTPNGTPVTRFSVAIDQNSEGPLWLTIICWRDLAERMSTMLFKGALVFVEGRLVVRKYTGKDKVERTTIEINANNVQLLEKKKGEQTEEDETEDHPF